MNNIEMHNPAYEAAVRSIVPQTFFNQASAIVEAHRPSDPALKDFEPLMMAGLKPNHHGELNGYNFHHGQPVEQRLARLTQLRGEYADDLLALEQIDIYDGDSLYHSRFGELSDAYESGNKAKQAEVVAWYREHYPLTSKSG